MRRITLKDIGPVLVFWGICGALAAGYAGLNLRLNVSSCVPLGFYQAHAAPRTLRRGEYVSFCPPLDNPEIRFARARGWLGKDGTCPGGVLSFTKTVGAVAGDTVSVTQRNGISVNGHKIDGAFVKSRSLGGAPIPHVPFGTYVVPKGEFFALATNNPDAFDSRYYGPIRVSDLRHRMTPFMTWK